VVAEEDAEIVDDLGPVLDGGLGLVRQLAEITGRPLDEVPVRVGDR